MITARAVPIIDARIWRQLDRAERYGRARKRMPVAARSGKRVDIFCKVLCYSLSSLWWNKSTTKDTMGGNTKNTIDINQQAPE